MLVLVKWDHDGTTNIVDRKEIKVIGGGRINADSRIKMWWGIERKWYKGSVLQVIRGKDVEESDNESTDFLLADVQPIETELNEAAEAVQLLNSSSFLNENLDESVCTKENIPNRSSESANGESSSEDDDDQRDPDYIVSDQSEDESSRTRVLVPLKVTQNNLNAPIQPERNEFNVEGTPREPLNNSALEKQVDITTSKRKKEIQKSRLKGDEYVSLSGTVKRKRRELKPRCDSKYCERNALGCSLVSEEHRNNILECYYNLETLDEQRKWLARHIQRAPTKMKKDEGRRSLTMTYFLPTDNKGDRVRVCKILFKNTLNITDRQIQTVVKKMTETGDVEPENRGGRPETMAKRDSRIRNLVKEHINRFPKMESHYCRSNTNFEYLSHELSITKMYSLYKDEYEGKEDDMVTFSYYYKVFRTLKLKFIQPKKDLCGICETFRDSTEEEKAKLQKEYDTHTTEKNKSRQLKQQIKESSPTDEFLGCFDLQQVIFLPRSNRSELFYKRRLSNYNFTVYDIKSKRGYCYVWHEGIGKRGANEISSNLSHFLRRIDEKNFRKVHLFCDGCSGQNKNSIICGMLLDTIQKCKNIEEIIIYYFETNHGQSEGDCMHSVIERAMKRVKQLITPSDLKVMIQLASDPPYDLTDITRLDILDFKSYSQTLGILKVRTTDDGVSVFWPNIMQLKVTREDSKRFYVKNSHNDEIFHEISLPSPRRSTEPAISIAYDKPLTIPDAKYNDLLSLCSGIHPVIKQNEHVTFYKSLNKSNR